MADESSEKQHQATGRRIDELRRKGQIMRSRDLSSGLIFISAIIMLIFMSSHMKSIIQDNFITAFSSIKNVSGNNDFLFEVLEKIVLNNFFMLLPLFIMVVLIAILSPFVFGGWNFTLQALKFKFETLDPISNLGRLFSKKMFLNVIKSLLKVIIIMSVLFTFSLNRKVDIVSLINLPLNVSMEKAYSIGVEFIVIISSSLVIIILYDVVTNFIEFNNKNKMTTQELKDEHKDTEGSSEVKRKLRSVQLALLRQRLSILVPKATVVITNPTHYAVAIKYDDRKDKAPKVVAKGKGHIAQQIRQLAITNHIPVYQAPLLARAIFNTSKLNTEINPGLYMGVAIVLSYVHQLKKYQHGKAQKPEYISDLKIPEELIFNE